MEHSIVREWANDNNAVLDDRQEKLLLRFADLLHETNKRYNLTGLKNKCDILTRLILESIEPLVNLDVPRGTLFADLGTGAGIPGIPAAIFFNNLVGTLIDSNKKKISFIKKAVSDLNLDNLNILNDRIEILAKERLREKFNIVFSRALGPLPVAVEMAASLLVAGGLLYIYSNDRVEDLSHNAKNHFRQLGMTVINRDEHVKYGFKAINVLLIKTGATKPIYPRKVMQIKRDMNKFK